MKRLLDFIDELTERRVRALASSTSRRSALVKVGKLMVAGAFTLPVLPFDRTSQAHAAGTHGGEVKNIGITGDEIFKQAGDLRLAHGIVLVAEQIGERHDLPLANQLLVKIDVEKLDLFTDRTGDFGLLNALRIGQLCLTELQNLTVVEGQRQHADQQHRAQNQPKDSRPAENCGFEAVEVHVRACPLFLAGLLFLRQLK